MRLATLPGVDAVLTLHRRNRSGAQTGPLTDEFDVGVGGSGWCFSVDFCSFCVPLFLYLLFERRVRTRA